LPDIPQIDDLSLRDHLVAQHAPRPGWREEFSSDASNVFVLASPRKRRELVALGSNLDWVWRPRFVASVERIVRERRRLRRQDLKRPF
jgi:hypothetical protein